MKLKNKVLNWLHTLHGKIFMICLSIAIGVMGISIGSLYARSVKTIEENAYNYVYESMKYADANLSFFMQDAIAISLSIATSDSIIEASIKEMPKIASYEWYVQREKTNDFLSRLIAYKSHIVMAAVVGVDGRSYQTGGELILKNIISNQWFEEMTNSLSVSILYNTPEDGRIYLCRPIKYQKETVAIAIIELDFNMLSKMYNIVPLEQSQVFAVDSDGDIVFTNSQARDLKNIKQGSLTQLIKEYKFNRRHYKIDGESKIAVLYKSPINQLTIIGLISYHNLITDALQIRNNMFWIITISILMAILSSWVFSGLVCRNIQKLQFSMKKIESGNLKERANIPSKDEIGHMASVFNDMMDRIEKLLEDVREKEKQKREAERTALQTQVQPHFIYNALNSIKYVAHMRDDSEIEEVSTSLIELIRSVLGNSEEFISLREEYTYIEHYMRIQRFKYRKEFSVIWDVEVDLWDFSIPKLLLQPIVENALIHGISRLESGCINIKVYRMEGKVIFRITDNGEGMTQTEINQLLLGQREDSNNFRGIGLHNVMERIKLVYGDQYGISMSSLKGVFTSVELTLPEKGGNVA